MFLLNQKGYERGLAAVVFFKGEDVLIIRKEAQSSPAFFLRELHAGSEALDIHGGSGGDDGDEAENICEEGHDTYRVVLK